MKTAEQIAEQAERFNGRANIAAINKAYRLQDQSHLWPINNKFNLTNRAIRKAAQICRQTAPSYGLEYCYLIESFINEYINKAAR